MAKDKDSRWQVLVVSPPRTFLFPLPKSRRVRVGGSPEAELRIEAAGVQAEQLSLRVLDDAIELTPLGTGTRLNDVQLSGRSEAHPGDQIAFGACRLIVQRISSLPASIVPPVLPHGLFFARLREELDRAKRHRSSLSMILIHSMSARNLDRDGMFSALSAQDSEPVVGLWGTRVLALLCPELDARGCEAALGRLATFLGRAGGPFQLGYATFPEEADDVYRLCERGLGRLTDGKIGSSGGEPVWMDPVMVRLSELVDSFATKARTFVIRGEPGTGKHAFARVIHRRATGSEQPFEVWPLVRASGGTLYVPRWDKVNPSMQAELLAGGAARLILSMPSGRTTPEVAVDVAFELPALRDRPVEILPLAASFLEQGCTALGRARLTLNERARQLLLTHPWPGNLRELKNAMGILALAVEGNEVDSRFLLGLLRGHSAEEAFGPEVDLRQSLASTERETLLRVLGQTEWNVTQAAKQLGLPRRTIVYRLRKLGVRRPQRSG